MSLQIRINQCLRDKGAKKTELADACKSPRATISDWSSGKTKSLSGEKLVLAAKFFNVNPEWLSSGNGKKNVSSIEATVPDLEPETNVQNKDYENLELVTFSSIPVVGVAQLNDNEKWTEIEHPTDFKGGIIDFPTRDKNAYALRCSGDSMEPRIRDGEFIVIEPNTEPQPGDDVLLKATDGRVMVKTFLYKREDKIHLISVNKAHLPQSIHVSEVDKMHYVLAAVRRPTWKCK